MHELVHVLQITIVQHEAQPAWFTQKALLPGSLVANRNFVTMPTPTPACFATLTFLSLSV